MSIKKFIHDFFQTFDIDRIKDRAQHEYVEGEEAENRVREYLKKHSIKRDSIEHLFAIVIDDLYLEARHDMDRMGIIKGRAKMRFHTELKKLIDDRANIEN